MGAGDGFVEVPAGRYALGEPGEERTCELGAVLIGRWPVVNAHVREFLGRRALEARDRHALRVGGPKHGAQGAAFAARVHALQDDQELVATRDVEAFLEVGELFLEGIEGLERSVLALGEKIGLVGGDPAQIETGTGFDG